MCDDRMKEFAEEIARKILTEGENIRNMVFSVLSENRVETLYYDISYFDKLTFSGAIMTDAVAMSVGGGDEQEGDE